MHNICRKRTRTNIKRCAYVYIHKHRTTLNYACRLMCIREANRCIIFVERTRKNIKKKCVASEHKYRVNQNDGSIEYFSNISIQINHKIFTRLSMKNPIELLDDFL